LSPTGKITEVEATVEATEYRAYSRNSVWSVAPSNSTNH